MGAKKMTKRLQIAVIGSAGPEEYSKAKPNAAMYQSAEELGKLLASKNCIIINGGKGGIMEAVCRGAQQNGGITVAEVSGNKRFTANAFVDVEIVTCDVGFRGPSQLIGMSDGVIAIGGGAGTLQELAVAYRMQKPVVLLTGFGGWTDRIAALKYMDERELIALTKAVTPQNAVQQILEMVR